MDVDGTGDDFSSSITGLEETYSRLSVFTHGIYIVGQEGNIVWAKSDTPGVMGAGISVNPDIKQMLTDKTSSISGLTSARILLFF